MTVVCEHPQHSVSAVAVAGELVFGVSPSAVVRFEPGADPVPLIACERMFASLAVDETRLYAALINEGTIFAVPHAGGVPELLADHRGRPLSLFCRRGWLGWVDQPFVSDPVRGPPYSSTRTSVCALRVDGGEVHELATHEGGAWDPAIAGERIAWVRGSGARPEIVSVAHGVVEPLITDFGELDGSGGFVHLASCGEHFIVAIPSKAWLRSGVELRRYSDRGDFLETIGFVAGHFNGLDAGEDGIALIVERGGSIVCNAWSVAGRSHTTLKVPRQPGPLVRAHVAADGVYFPVGNRVHRLEWG